MAKKNDKEEAPKQDDAMEKDGATIGASSEGEGESSGGEGLTPPQNKLAQHKKIIIAGALGVLLLGGGAVGLYASGILGGHKTNTDETANQGHASSGQEGTEAEKSHDEKVGLPVFYSLGDILVNLAGDGKRPNFLKIKVSLELADEKDKAAIEAMKPRIVDNFQIYLRELRVEDLRGSAGLQRLREELLLRVTEVAAPVRVREVLFQEMLVQ